MSVLVVFACGSFARTPLPVPGYSMRELYYFAPLVGEKKVPGSSWAAACRLHARRIMRCQTEVSVMLQHMWLPRTIDCPCTATIPPHKGPFIGASTTNRYPYRTGHAWSIERTRVAFHRCTTALSTVHGNFSQQHPCGLNRCIVWVAARQVKRPVGRKAR